MPKLQGGNCEKLGEKFCEMNKSWFLLKFSLKNAKHVSTCEAKGLFLWKYFDGIIFCQIFAKTFVFPKVFHENMCKTGANTWCSLQKLTVFEKKELFSQSFRENTKNLVIFAKIFAAMFTKAKFFLCKFSHFRWNESRHFCFNPSPQPKRNEEK